VGGLKVFELSAPAVDILLVPSVESDREQVQLAFEITRQMHCLAGERTTLD
jgi:hypothetical protein